MERWWLSHSDTLCVPEWGIRRIGGTRTRDLPAPAGRATDCAAIRRAFLPTGGDGTPLREPRDRRTCPACGENATFMPHPRRALGRIRTGDAHLRKVALYPLSYRGIRLRVAGTPQHVSRFEGVHIALLLLAVALRIATAFTY